MDNVLVCCYCGKPTNHLIDGKSVCDNLKCRDKYLNEFFKRRTDKKCMKD